MLGTGYDNRSIAHQLDISERTVKRHITAILLKLDLESRLQAGLVGLAASLGPGATS
jgi:DNA-binding NarL/FixJ family response regulator